MKKIGFFVILVLFFLIFILLFWFFIRLFNLREVDDVSPAIPCSDDLLVESDILWVIPIFENVSIGDYPEWCRFILGFNKTLGLHGVYHLFEEFSYDRDINYLNRGIKSFEKCFGFRPRLFKPPHLSISDKNREMIENDGYYIKARFNQLTHKVYHCADNGEFPNRFIDIF